MVPFILNNIPDGSYKLIIEYKGYDNLSVPFIISGTTPVSLGLIKLGGTKVKENNIQELLLQSVYKASQARAITMKRIPIQSQKFFLQMLLENYRIVMLPMQFTVNTGVSIRTGYGRGRFVAVRGTPIQWTASTLNGKQNAQCQRGDNANRGIQMDIFPSELIQNVRLSKALTPDL